MRPIVAQSSTRRRAIDELDINLLGSLEDRDKRLYVLLSKTTRYRNILRGKMKRLRAGSAPEGVRALLAQWDPILREIKRLAQDL